MSNTEDIGVKKLVLTEIESILANYGLGEVLEVKSLTQGYANENLLVSTAQKAVLYRVCKQQPLHLIEYELRLMKALKAAKIRTAFPIGDRHGQMIQKSGEHHVVLYDFVEGHEPELNERTAFQIGTEVGKLSQIPLSEQFEKKNAIHLDECRHLIDAFATCKNPMPQIFKYFIEQTKYLDHHLDDSLPMGIVHGDIFPNNTIYQDNELQAIIDFEEACSDQLMFDVCMTINGFCFVWNELKPKLLKSFISGYNQERELTEKEIAALPIYMQWGSHGMLSWHLKNNLINQPLEEQHKRVIELMERTQWMRSNEIFIRQIIEE